MKLLNSWMSHSKCLVLDLSFFSLGDDLHVAFSKGLKQDGIAVVTTGRSN